MTVETTGAVTIPSVAVTGGAINNATIGATTPSTGTFTTLSGTTSVTTPIVQNSAAAAIAFKTNFSSSAITQFNISHTASAVNYVQVTGAATGAGPVISAQGSDASLSLQYRTKSNFNHVFQNGNAQANFVVNQTAGTSIANYLQVASALTSNAPILSSQGSDTDIDLTLTPKGAGAVRFGTYTGTILSPTGYITIKDSGGTSRRLLVG